MSIFYLVDATGYGYTGVQDSSSWAALTVAALVAAGVCSPSSSFAAAGG